jgi:hypothetical protein
MSTKIYEPTAAIWEKPTKNGGTYLSLKTADGKYITFFKNNRKTNPNQPDWYEAKPQGQEGLQENQGGSFPTDSDIPF